MHAGGYSSDGAALAIAIAALLTIGMGFVGLLWEERRRFTAVFIALCFISGEAYWLGMNVDRELSAREAQAAPFAKAVAIKNAARARFDDAKAAKLAADAAAVSEAAKPGCRANCAKLLGDAQLAADNELAAARAAYGALPDPVAASSLASHLNVPAWAWDLIMAGLRSLATMGASVALGAALHRKRTPQSAAVAPQQMTTVDTEIAAAKPITQPRRQKPKPTLALPPPRDDGLEHVSQFLKHAGFRPDPLGAASLMGLQHSYSGWCRSRELAALPPKEFGRQLRSIVDAIGLECEPTQGDVIIRGATIH